jgi:glycine/D-amino acid oxidase-like deaminating enzyme
MAKAVIVGAGINGLATARALLLRGWRVEVLERGPIPNPEAASFDRSRLIRDQYAGQPGYAARLPGAFAAWDRLWADLGRIHYIERGVLALSRAEGDWTDRARAAFDAVGVPYGLLGPEEVGGFGVFETEGVRFGLHSPRGGLLLADRILADLAAWLDARGAVLRPHTPIERVDAAAGRVSGPAGGAEGDAVVLAAGVGLPALAPATGAFRPHRATVLYLDPPPGFAEAWARAPAWVDLGGEDDLWGMPPAADMDLKIGYGRLTAPGDPARDRAATAADVAAIRGAYAGRLRGIERAALREAVTNFYLMAPGERFHLSRTGRVVVLSADSGHGFKFGALTGEDVADAVDGGDFEAAVRRLAGEAPAPA